MPLPEPRIAAEGDERLDGLAQELHAEVSSWSKLLSESAAQILRDAGLEASDEEATRLASRLLNVRANEIAEISKTLANRPRGHTVSVEQLVRELEQLQKGNVLDPENKRRRAEIKRRLSKREE